MADMQKEHPELREGEVWIGNIKDEAFKSSCWRTKRQGDRAYNIHGDLIKNGNLRPMFVQKSEMDADKDVQAIRDAKRTA